MASTSKAQMTVDAPNSEQIEMRESSRPRAMSEGQEQVARTIVEKTVEAATRTTGAAAEVIRDLTRRVADQSQEAVRLGMHAVAGAQAPLVDAGYDHGRRMMETTARISDICHGATQRAADDMQALTGSFYNLALGAQKFQQVYFDLVTRSMDSAFRKRQELFRAKSAVESAEIQRDLYLATTDSMFTGCKTLLEATAQIAHDAIQPLQTRGWVHKQD
jgi:Phasin protein